MIAYVLLEFIWPSRPETRAKRGYVGGEASRMIRIFYRSGLTDNADMWSKLALLIVYWARHMKDSVQVSKAAAIGVGAAATMLVSLLDPPINIKSPCFEITSS